MSILLYCWTLRITMDKAYWIMRGKTELANAGATPDQCANWADKAFLLNLANLKKEVDLIMYRRYTKTIQTYIDTIGRQPPTECA
jgi:hypothetical protein